MMAVVMDVSDVLSLLDYVFRGPWWEKTCDINVCGTHSHAAAFFLRTLYMTSAHTRARRCFSLWTPCISFAGLSLYMTSAQPTRMPLLLSLDCGHDIAGIAMHERRHHFCKAMSFATNGGGQI